MFRWLPLTCLASVVAELINLYNDNEDLLMDLLNIILHSENLHLIIAACRFVVATQGFQSKNIAGSMEEEVYKRLVNEY